MARGRALAQPVPAGVRPTAARVREALFSIVGQDLAGVTVLDAFGGTGLLGLEAWSRGAEVTLVERDPRAADGIRANAAALGAGVRVVVGDATVVAPGLGRFGLVLVDPPYAADAAPILACLAPAVDGALVLEHDAAVPPPELAGLRRERTRTYGGTSLTIWRRGAP